MDKIKSLENKIFSINGGKVFISVGQYRDSVAVIIKLTGIDGHPYATLTTNIPDIELKENEILVKAWSENKIVAKAALESGLFEDTGKRVETGFVEAQIWRVK